MAKKFNVCIMNPPFVNLYYRFVDKCLDCSHQQVSLFPFLFITKLYNPLTIPYKDKFSKYLIDCAEIPGSSFTGTSMANVGIYYFSDKKTSELRITINYIDLSVKTYLSLSQIREFDEYELLFIKYIENVGPLPIIHANPSLNKDIQYKRIETNKILDKIHECYKLNKECCVLNVNIALNDERYYTSRSGKLFPTYDDLFDYYMKTKCTFGYWQLIFKNKCGAENCLAALTRPLFMFILYKTKLDLFIKRQTYRYIPNIKWEDDLAKTDIGILLLCGMNREMACEFVEYCKEWIKRNRPQDVKNF